MPLKRPVRSKRSKAVPEVGASEDELFKYAEKQLKAPLTQALNAFIRNKPKDAAAFVSRWLDPLPGEDAGRVQGLEEDASSATHDEEFLKLKGHLDTSLRPLLVQAIQDAIRGGNENLASFVGRHLNKVLEKQNLDKLKAEQQASAPSDPAFPGSPKGKLTPRVVMEEQDPLAALQTGIDQVATNMTSAIDSLKSAFNAANERVFEIGPSSVNGEVQALIGHMEMTYAELYNALMKSEVALKETIHQVRLHHGAIPSTQQVEILGVVAGTGLEAERALEEISNCVHSFSDACGGETMDPQLQACLEGVRNKVLSAVKTIDREIKEDMEDLRKYLHVLYEQDKAAIDHLLKTSKGQAEEGTFEGVVEVLRKGNEKMIAFLEEATERIKDPTKKKRNKAGKPPVFGCLVHAQSFYGSVHSALIMAHCPADTLLQVECVRNESLEVLTAALNALGKAAKKLNNEENPNRFDLKAEEKFGGVAKSVMSCLEAYECALLEGLNAEEDSCKNALTGGEQDQIKVKAIVKSHKAAIDAKAYDLVDFVKSAAAQGEARRNSVLSNLLVGRDVIMKMQKNLEDAIAYRLKVLGPASNVSSNIRDFARSPGMSRDIIEAAFEKLAAIVPEDHELHSDFGSRCESPVRKERKSAWTDN